MLQRSLTILFILLVLAGVLPAAPEARGPSSGVLADAPIIRTTNRIAPESVLPFRDAGDGIWFTVLRFSSDGAEATRLTIEDLRLPPGTRMLVYGLQDAAAVQVQSYEGSGPGFGEFRTGAVLGTDIYVELQVSGDLPADLPFRVTEISPTTVAEVREIEAAESSSEVRTSKFRGMSLTHKVQNGLAIYEGDIILGNANELEQASEEKNARREAVAITGSRYRWPGGVVPYAIDPAVPNTSRIASAVDHWNNMLSGTIRMVPRTNESNYVVFVPGSSAGLCSSYIGMIGGGQPIQLGAYCSTGAVIHEIGHAVGLWHEQSREDRNNYVRILTENIQSGMLYNFNQSIAYGDDIGQYDYGSIMHYGQYSFSANGLPTIETIPPGIPIGQRQGLSSKDIAGVRAIYGGTAPPPPPSYAAVTIQSNPAGMPVIVDGTAYTSTMTFNWLVGSTHTVSAQNPAATSNTRSTFAYWSNGGSQTQSVVASTSVPVLTAHYTRYYAVIAAAAPAGAGTVTISPASSDSFYALNTYLNISANPNTGYCFTGWTGLIAGTPASTSLTVTAPFALTANFAPGAYSLSSPRRYLPNAAGATFTVGVNANTGCTWTAKSNSSWISVAPANGSGSQSVTITVPPNYSGYSRFGSVTIAGIPFYVYQPVYW